MISKSVVEKFRTVEHSADFCVIGGGIAGMLAAISAARHGAKVLLMQDRPVLGGNASSEIRMWIRGAHGDNMRETGIMEEIALENIYRNPTLNYSIWDSVLYEKVRFQENLELILNCSCCDAMMNGGIIASIKGWQTTTQTFHNVKAKIFSDCSGDSILAPLTGAEWRMGREGCEEFGEDIAPPVSDNKTMGLSCLLQARETTSKIKYTPPKWANKYTQDDFPMRLDVSNRKKWTKDNFWWMELGGVRDTIKDTEEIRDDLLKVAFGVWDFIKNSGNFDADNWDIEWVGFLPGKRESRRYIGDYILTQNDIRSGGHFEDLVAYGGWKMDDHHPEGLLTKEAPTIFHPAPSPYGIPYRCLYSENIKNLMFAGRNISTTHSALSSYRVQATCGIIGQAMGTAAAMAIKNNVYPRDIYLQKINELKQTLMEDDCYLPFNQREKSKIIKEAVINSANKDSDLLRNGTDRDIDMKSNLFITDLGSPIVFELKEKINIQSIRLIFDSDLNRESWEGEDFNYKAYPMKCNIFLNANPVKVPATLIKSFAIEVEDENGAWEEVFFENNNYQRYVNINLNIETQKIRLIPKETWGSEKARIFSVDFK